jgi:hypothetical protein
MDEIGSNKIKDYIFDDDGSFDTAEAELALQFEYNTSANSTLQP